MTYPMVGNYGIPDPEARDEFGLLKGFESDKIQASALIVQDYSAEYSHWTATTSLGEWLEDQVTSRSFLSPCQFVLFEFAIVEKTYFGFILT